MQSCKSCKTVSVRSGKLSIGRLLLTGSLAFWIPLTQVQAAPLCASPCTLAWDSSPDPLISGYAIYYGVTGSTMTNRVDAGLTNQVTVNNLSAGSNYFFCVVAYNVGGLESQPSKVMCYAPPAVSGLELNPLTNNTMNVRFQVATGSVCHVEFTPKLNPPQWRTLGSATADANGNVTINDPLTGKLPYRFYRAAVP